MKMLPIPTLPPNFHSNNSFYLNTNKYSNLAFYINSYQFSYTISYIASNYTHSQFTQAQVHHLQGGERYYDSLSWGTSAIRFAPQGLPLDISRQIVAKSGKSLNQQTFSRLGEFQRIISYIFSEAPLSPLSSFSHHHLRPSTIHTTHKK